jgi:hypothetical protein
MKEYYVTKKITDPDEVEVTGLSNEDLDNPDEIEDVTDEFERFYVVKLRDKNNKDLTHLVDTNMEFDDDDELAEYLGKILNEDPDEIEIVEDESTIEYKRS